MITGIAADRMSGCMCMGKHERMHQYHPWIWHSSTACI